MSLTVLCSIVVAFYVVLWFFDAFFKSCMHYPYFAFLEGTGLKFGVFCFSWTTTAFNRCMYRWSKNLTRILRKWYSFGCTFTLCLFLPFSMWTVLSFLWDNYYDTTEISRGPEIKAIVPGINLPVYDLWVYVLSLGFSTIFHELGHALAAAQEDVQLISVGFYVITIVPIAFVELNTEHLNNLAIMKRLRIYSAGVWHNVATALMAFMLFLSAPILFNIAYSTGHGVRVTGLTHDSPLRDVRGFDVGDIITSINNCDIKIASDWNFCLYQAHERFGICTSAEFISQNDEIMMETVKENDVVECCRKDDLYSFCFEYMEPKVVADSLLPGQYSCLKPRDMVKDQFVKCTEPGGYVCPRAMHCLKPSLNNHTYLMIIHRQDNKGVLYLGMPYDLHKTVFVDQYFPRLSMFSFFSPSQFEMLLKYIFVFSMGIAFVNILPCYGMDGEHISKNLIQLLAKYLNKNSEFVKFFSKFTVAVGTGVTVVMMIYVMYKMIHEHQEL